MKRSLLLLCMSALALAACSKQQSTSPGPADSTHQHGPGSRGLDFDPTARGPGQPVHDAAAGFQQWLCDAAAG